MFTWLQGIFAPKSDTAALRHAKGRNLQRSHSRRVLLRCEPLEDRWLPTVTPIVGPNVNIIQASGSQAETAIAVNPLNKKNLFATCNGDFYKFSMDGGVTWQDSNVSALPSSCCDQQ